MRVKYTIVGYYSLPDGHYEQSESFEQDLEIDRLGFEDGALQAEDLLSWSDEDPEVTLELE